jgi:hypothetical protein
VLGVVALVVAVGGLVARSGRRSLA